MLRSLLALALTFAVAVPFAAHAVTIDEDGTIHYDVKRERFYVPPDDELDDQAVSSVVIREIPFEKLPDELRENVTTLINECAKGDGEENRRKIKLYSYVSERHRDKDLPASYFADTRGLYSIAQKTCSIGDICNKDGCHILGFSAEGDDNWTVQKSVRLMNWGVAEAKAKDGTIVTYFQMMTNQGCDEGTMQQGACTQNYRWVPAGFARYDLPPQMTVNSIVKGQSDLMPKNGPAATNDEADDAEKDNSDSE